MVNSLRCSKVEEGILVVRNGKAGTTCFLGKGKYTITDHAYILTLKNSCKYEVSLKWFMNQYRNEFFEYASSSDNATWNMTGFFDNTIIDIPSSDEQLKFVERYDCLESLQTRMEGIQERIAELLSRQLAVQQTFITTACLLIQKAFLITTCFTWRSPSEWQCPT